MNRHLFHKWELVPETINIIYKVIPVLYVVSPEKRFCPTIEAEVADINYFSRIHHKCTAHRFSIFNKIILRPFYMSDVAYRSSNLYIKAGQHVLARLDDKRIG